MKVQKRVSADFMVATFLAGEIDSPRNGHAVHGHLESLAQTRALVDHADLDDPAENALRLRVLGGTRGYPDGMLFAGLPAAIEWCSAFATRNEVPLFRYGAESGYPAWWALSAGTGIVGDGAARVELVQLDQNINQQIRNDADAFRDGTDRGSLIVVSSTMEGPMVLLDGCARATAYALAGDDGPSEVAVLVGLSDEIAAWAWWRG